jgi:hypothetical protein
MDEALHLDSGGGDGGFIVGQQRGMRHPTPVHQLAEDVTSFPVNLGRHLLPPFQVRVCVHPGRPDVPPPVRRGRRPCSAIASALISNRLQAQATTRSPAIVSTSQDNRPSIIRVSPWYNPGITRVSAEYHPGITRKVAMEDCGKARTF